MAHSGRGHARGVINTGRQLFDSAAIIIEGRPLRALRIVCGLCGSTDVIRMNSMRRGCGKDEPQENRIAARKFVEMGWEVAVAAQRHRCPKCIEKRIENRKPIEIFQQGDQPMALNLTPVPAPKQMTREDRRIIFEKLNEVYGDEKSGYLEDWTDKAVANHLGVPFAWVATIRDENFGPVGSNSKIDETVAKAIKLIEESKGIAAKLLSGVADLEGKLVDIQKRVRP